MDAATGDNAEVRVGAKQPTLLARLLRHAGADGSAHGKWLSGVSLATLIVGIGTSSLLVMVALSPSEPCTPSAPCGPDRAQVLGWGSLPALIAIGLLAVVWLVPWVPLALRVAGAVVALIAAVFTAVWAVNQIW